MLSDIIQRTSEKLGIERVRYKNKNLPDRFSDIVFIPFLGDIRSRFIFSTFILNRYVEANPSNYFVLHSWPGYDYLFPYTHEYWTFKEKDLLVDLSDKAAGFSNSSEKASVYEKNFLRYFDNVLTGDFFVKYYNNGITKYFLDTFHDITYTLPMIPSLDVDTLKKFKLPGKKIFISPIRYCKKWQQHQEIPLLLSRDFWVLLGKSLIANGMIPVIYQDYSTYDISSSLAGCVYITNTEMSFVLSVMRTCDCVLDVFSDISGLARIARSPYVACVERERYSVLKEFELDDLYNTGLPFKYIFSFPTMIESDGGAGLIHNIVSKLSEFLPVDKNSLPSTTERYVSMGYNSVRELKMNRIGARFFKIPQY